MKKMLLCLLVLLCLNGVVLPQPTEFEKGMVLNLEFFQGFTKASESPEFYLADLRLSPQWAVVPGILRVGVTGGVLYTRQVVSAFGGPNLALHLKTINAGSFGSFLNVHLLVEHLWGSDGQGLLGGGFRTEIGKKLLLSVLTHRDYHLGYWNVQFGVGIHLLRKKSDPIIVNSIRLL